MPPRKYYRRRSRRRFSKKLKTTSILNNKSAKSQANQILALRKYVRRVRKMIPPVNKMVSSGTQQEYTFSSSDFTNVGAIHRFPYPYLYQGDDGAIIENDDQDYRTGNWIKIYQMYYSVSLSYDFTAGDNGQFDGNYSGAQIRFVMLATRRYDQSPPNSLAQIFQIVGNTNTSYNLNMTTPLKEGINNQFIVLGQRKYTLSTTNRIKSFRLHIPIKKFRSYASWQVGDGLESTTTYPRHQVYLAILTSGLKYQGILSAATNTVRISIRPWLVFSNP